MLKAGMVYPKVQEGQKANVRGKGTRIEGQVGREPKVQTQREGEGGTR